MNATAAFSELDLNSNVTLSGTLQFDVELDILFQPEIVLISLYIPVILLSLLANILLIVVAVKCNYTKSVTNIFLVNLSAADLLVTGICMPIQLSKAFTLVWFYGESVCKIVNYIQGVAVAASVFTLTAMSVDRWLSISPEPRLRPPSRKQALLLLAVLWLIALSVFIPLLMIASVRRETVPIISKTSLNLSVETKDVHFCTEEWPSPVARKQFGIFGFTLVYAVPGSITILSYACMGRTLCSVRPPFDIDEGNASMQQGLRLMKERKRVAWILLLLAVLFALCWLPYNIMQLLLDINVVNAKDLSIYLPYALLIGHANSAINPIVYCLMTRNFQRSVHKLLCGRGVCRQTNFTMNTLRYNGHTHNANLPRVDTRMTSQLSHATRSSRRTAPAHALSVEMLQRHGHIDMKR
ncbi:neuropeptide FF receptor 2-like isoform X2 [Leptidea sinapis]|uniref:neuropeptide FF receptor 2-like isoform X2 n=1 Tax=Leptidea sinapis TaxID=189913 RepID=UPI0021250C06|nr:neuropeptide FF receptor 2-like isoform X2 [Leptidea sinapis]